MFAHHWVEYAYRADVLTRGSLDFVRAGASGVSIFFAISGFLMAMLMERQSPWEFITNRVLRIYPGFLIAVALSVLIRLAATGEPGNFQFLPAITLLPVGHMRYPLNIEWTLIFEVFFYCVITALCFVPTLFARKVFIGAWAAAIMMFGSWANSGWVLDIALSKYNLAFILGMAIWWYGDRIKFEGVVPFVLSAAMIPLARQALPMEYSLLVVSFASALMVLSAVRTRLFSADSLFKRLGDASYGLYLIHAVLFMTLFSMVGGHSVGWFLVVGCAVFALALCYGAFEHWFYGQMKKARRQINAMYLSQLFSPSRHRI